MKRLLASILAVCALAAPMRSAAIERFPKPEFDSGYVLKTTITPPPRVEWLEYLDVGVLALALAVASYIVLVRRSRRETFLLAVLSLLYFGFWRKGCLCPVGSVQNVAIALADPSYLLPWATLAFFALPLLFTLFFGRTFCAAVCPLGTIQDIVLVRPRRVPTVLARGLEVIPVMYLAVGVLLAMAGARFVVCKYDPFVGFFRTSGPPEMLIAGAVLLAIGTVYGRPYCRFLCPYSVLLSWMSALSKWHVGITPNECVQCRLCEESCPFDSILVPPPARAPEKRWQGVRRVAWLVALAPVLILGGGWLGSRAAVPLSMAHKDVAVAEQVAREDSGKVRRQTVDSETFRKSGKSRVQLFDEATAVRRRLAWGGWLAGGFVGGVVCFRLLGLAVRRKREDYIPDRASCVSCTRCFEYCPKEHERIKKQPEIGRPASGPGP
jgi:ferredoxin